MKTYKDYLIEEVSFDNAKSIIWQMTLEQLKIIDSILIKNKFRKIRKYKEGATEGFLYSNGKFEVTIEYFNNGPLSVKHMELPVMNDFGVSDNKKYFYNSSLFYNFTEKNIKSFPKNKIEKIKYDYDNYIKDLNPVYAEQIKELETMLKKI